MTQALMKTKSCLLHKKRSINEKIDSKDKVVPATQKCSMEALIDSIQMKLEEHTEFIKDDIENLPSLVIEGTDTLKRKIEDQAAEVKSLKKKLNEMDEKMDKMMLLLGGSVVYE